LFKEALLTTAMSTLGAKLVLTTPTRPGKNMMNRRSDEPKQRVEQTPQFGNGQSDAGVLRFFVGRELVS
jgi:hypothetical protein